MTSAASLSLGGSVAGRIEPASDEDVFKVVLDSAADLWVYADGELDSVGELLDSTGNRIAFNDQGYLLDAGAGFSIRRELAAGTYYVRVHSHRALAAGSYAVYARTATDPGDSVESATTVTLDSVNPGRISAGSSDSDFDQDYFRLDLSAAADIWVIAAGELDTVGELLDSEGNLLEANDDSGYLGSDVGFMLRRSLDAGTYYIRVRTYDYADEGTYTLFVREAGEPGNSAETALPLTLGAAEPAGLRPAPTATSSPSPWTRPPTSTSTPWPSTMPHCRLRRRCLTIRTRP